MMDVSAVAITVAAIAACCVFLYFFGRKVARFLYLTSKIPGPSLWQVLTCHAKHLVGDEMIHYTCKLCASYNYKLWGMWISNLKYVVFVSDCEDISAVYKSKATKDKPAMFYKAISEYTGDSLLTMNGPQYARHRKVFGAGLRTSLQDHFLRRIPIRMTEFVEALRKETVGGKTDVDLRDLVTLHLIDTMAASFMSTYYADFSSVMHKLPSTISRIMELIYTYEINPLYYWLCIHFRPSSKQARTLAHKLIAEFDEMWKREKHHALGDTRQDCEDSQYAAQAMRLTFLNTANGEDTNSEDWLAMGRTLGVASFETTGFALNTVLLVLGLYQDVQQRVWDEIESVWGNEGLVLSDHLQRLEYTDMVIKETLRLFPVGPLVPREVREDVVISGSLVPAGSIIMMNVMALHRNPEYYPDPLKFDPSRFSPESSEERPPYTYLPFSTGTRSCPGQLHALLIMKLMLCYILRNFRILPGDRLKSLDDIKVRMCFTMHLNDSSLRLVNRRAQ